MKVNYYWIYAFKRPDFIEISAAALLLHSFFNGVENILVLIFKHYGEELPTEINGILNY